MRTIGFNDLKIQENKTKDLDQENKQLLENLSLLKQDLIERNNYIFMLKKRVLEGKGGTEKQQEKTRQQEFFKNEVLKLKNNLNILKSDLIEKENYINFLRKQEIKANNSTQTTRINKLKEELSKKDVQIKLLNEEKQILDKKTKELEMYERKYRTKHEREERLLFNVTDKLRKEMARSEMLKTATRRNHLLELKNNELSDTIHMLSQELNKKKDEIDGFNQQIEENKAVSNKLHMTLKKLKDGIGFVNKENIEIIRKLKKRDEEIDILKQELDLSNDNLNKNKKETKGNIEEEEKYHKEQIRKFIKQYFKVKIFSESEIRGLKKNLDAQEKEKDILKSKIDFLKYELNKHRNNELDLKAELEVLKQEKQ
ncbi:hypothetical protein HQ529_02995 [Candidatus Woesearchaeota archaeon]|nr:hypothetical protein [Candidatus Woesearchaeota archaeon]